MGGKNPLSSFGKRLGEGVSDLRSGLSRDGVRGLFTSRRFKTGGYTALVCVAIVAVAVIAVSLVEALPASVTQIDLSRDQTTSISDETTSYLAELDDDEAIDIYLICEQGSEDDYLTRLLDQYAAASDRVSVIQKDPVLHPTFTSQYTSDELSDNSLIITCGDKYEVIAYDSLYSLNYATYSYEFAGESAITGAITTLTSEDLPQIYVLSGHDEASLPTDAQSELESASYSLETLSLLSSGEVPDDADAVIAYMPASDLSDAERDALLAYLEGGGHFLLISSYEFTAASMPNFAEVMAAYGMQAQEGLVVEGDASQMVSGYPYYLLPTIAEHDITADLAGGSSYVLFPLAHGLAETSDHVSSVSVESLLLTSDSAWIKADPNNAETLEYEDGDLEGQTSVGLVATEDVDDEQARVVWYSTPYFLESDVDAMVSGANSGLLVSTVSWLTGIETPTSGLASKGFGYSAITVDASTASLLSVVVVGLVPGAALVAGLVIWQRRRRG